MAISCGWGAVLSAWWRAEAISPQPDGHHDVHWCQGFQRQLLADLLSAGPAGQAALRPV